MYLVEAMLKKSCTEQVTFLKTEEKRKKPEFFILELKIFFPEYKLF